MKEFISSKAMFRKSNRESFDAKFVLKAIEDETISQEDCINALAEACHLICRQQTALRTVRYNLGLTIDSLKPY